MRKGVLRKAVCVGASAVMATMMLPVQAFASSAGGNSAWAENTIASLPSTFDLRDCDLVSDDGNAHENYVTSTKNQFSFGTCWVFGSLAACESSILSSRHLQATDASGNDTTNLSEKQIAYFFHNNAITADQDASQEGEGFFMPALSNEYNSGGFGMSVSDLVAGGQGVSEESSNKQFSYNGYDESTGQVTDTMGGDWNMSDDTRFYSDYSLVNSSFLPAPATNSDYFNPVRDEGVAAIKSELSQGRAVAIGYCADTSSSDQLNRPSIYINLKTWAHYTYEEEESNHEVCIVGWDDNFSKENFASEQPVLDADGKAVTDKNGDIVTKKVSQPEGDGAWIVKNSWGATTSKGADYYDTWGVDGTGYFYISYYDKSIVEPITFTFDTEDTDYIIDQTDHCPTHTCATLGSDGDLGYCNVFTAKQDEKVSRLMAYVQKQNSTVTYTLYRLNSKCTDPGQGEKLYSTTVDYKYGGWQSIDLPQTFDMPKGTRYAVEIQTMDGNGEYYCTYARDWNENGYATCKNLNVSLSESASYIKGVVNEGESYLYDDGEWTDATEIYTDEENEYYDYDNFPIKAYCTAGVDSTKNLSAAKVTVGSGGKYTGKAKTPAVKVTLNGKTVDAANYKIIYSDNVNAGKATVTVSGLGSWSGEASATFTIAKIAQGKAKITTATKAVSGCKKGKLAKAKTFLLAKSGVKGSAKVTWSKALGNAKIVVGKAGKVTVKKGLKKGSYKVKVKMAIAATTNYKAKTVTKTITVKVK